MFTPPRAFNADQVQRRAEESKRRRLPALHNGRGATRVR